ncbi:MAG TPA: sensor domain-containing diguanylate cyclase [Dehalococcoidia bacterium]|nr:sensor domain-containing diguanylate cyclase [Dehalococcoidia bacterium]
MFGKTSRKPILLIHSEPAALIAAREALEAPESPFDVHIAGDLKTAVDKLPTNRWECLVVDPRILAGTGVTLGHLAEAATSDAALVVISHKHHPRGAPDLKGIAGLTFLDAEDLRRPGLPERISECLDVARAVKAGQVDALMVPMDGALSLMLAAGSDAVYRVLVETMQEGILTVDSEGVILFTNVRLGEILDCDPDSILGENLLALIDSEERLPLRERIDDVLAGAACRCELAFALPDRPPVHTLISLSPIEAADGSVSSACLAVTDLSEEKRLREELQELAITDPLTGLYNRRHLQEALERECRRARRYRRPLSCLMIDLDDFKFVNDSFGHLAGDDVLRQAAHLIAESARDTDVVARYGGDEFLVLLTETTLEGAIIMAERVRSSIAEYEFNASGQPCRCSVSIGAGSAVQHDDFIPEVLVSYADVALFEAKTAGKDQIRSRHTPAAGVA